MYVVVGMFVWRIFLWGFYEGNIENRVDFDDWKISCRSCFMFEVVIWFLSYGCKGVVCDFRVCEDWVLGV